MPLITLEDVRQLIPWHDIRRVDLPKFNMSYIALVPSTPSLAKIEFAFSGNLDFLQAFCFGEWHAHVDLDRALEMADELVTLKKCILEERNRSGQYEGSSIVSPGESLSGVRDIRHSFRRVFFNRAPANEAIDASLFVRMKHGWISSKRKHEIETAYRKLGLPLPEYVS